MCNSCTETVPRLNEEIETLRTNAFEDDLAAGKKIMLLERQLEEANDKYEQIISKHTSIVESLEKQVRELKGNNEFFRKELSKPKDNAPF